MPRHLKSTGETALLQKHVDCVGCGYDLFQQPLDGHCPECNTPVRRSRVRLPLDSDMDWQAQIDRGLWLRTAATSAWAACFVVVIIGVNFPSMSGLLLFAAVATVGLEIRSSQLLWVAPAGCEPMVSTRARRVGRSFEGVHWLGLIAFGLVGIVGDPSASNRGCVVAIVGVSLLLLGLARIPAMYRLYMTIAREIGAERLPRDLFLSMIPRITIEPALFLCLICGLAGPTLSQSEWDGGLLTFTWLSVIAFGIALPFHIGAMYELWRRVREVRQLEHEEESEIGN